MRAEPEATLNGFCVGLLAFLDAGMGVVKVSARVSVIRAACGRCCGASFALKNLFFRGTKYQMNEHLNDCERYQK